MQKTGGKMTARERERARKRRKRRRYGQASLKHARKGVLSCGIAGSVLLLYLVLIAYSFLHKGQSAAMSGSFGIFGFILACTGLSNAVRGFRERDKNYLTCWIGAGGSAFVLICLAATFIRGLV